ncbi:hypothetical protein [Streptomyces sp. SM12]|uniref:hypothetical protein n=1 Tax=Streptomyces sp. SM12 TaxID=1071602 RepID=UPI000CD50294|nr:hypothetical protein [Streptomyces sp. SM12]
MTSLAGQLEALRDLELLHRLARSAGRPELTADLAVTAAWLTGRSAAPGHTGVPGQRDAGQPARVPWACGAPGPGCGAV